MKVRVKVKVVTVMAFTEDCIKVLRGWKEKKAFLDHEHHFPWPVFNMKPKIKSLSVLLSEAEPQPHAKMGKSCSCSRLL